MRIQSTQTRPAPRNSRRTAYAESLDTFDKLAPKAERRYAVGSNLTGVVALPPALAVGAAGAALLGQLGNLSLDGLPSALQIPVMLGAVTGVLGGTGLGMLATIKVVHGKLAKSPQFEEFRAEHSQVRDAYREELLDKADDEGVEEIFSPRWLRGNEVSEESYSVGGPVGKETILNTMVDDLEWLVDMRQTEDWRGDIAREQDDPLVAKRLIREAASDPGHPGHPGYLISQRGVHEPTVKNR